MTPAYGLHTCLAYPLQVSLGLTVDHLLFPQLEKSSSVFHALSFLRKLPAVKKTHTRKMYANEMWCICGSKVPHYLHAQ